MFGANFELNLLQNIANCQLDCA